MHQHWWSNNSTGHLPYLVSGCFGPQDNITIHCWPPICAINNWIHSIITHVNKYETSLHFKTKSTRKLSNFKSQWTKTLCQNNLKYYILAYIFEGLKMLLAICNNTKKISYGSSRNEIYQISQNYILHMKFSKFYLCIQNCSEILAFIFSDFHYRVSLVLLQMTN